MREVLTDDRPWVNVHPDVPGFVVAAGTAQRPAGAKSVRNADSQYFLAIKAPLLKALPAGDPLASDARQGLERQINAWFTQIQKVTRDRIDEWKTRVTDKGQGSVWEALIAIVIAGWRRGSAASSTA